MRFKSALVACLSCIGLGGTGAAAGLSTVIPAATASADFGLASRLCHADAGRLWGISLCGPMIFADPVTREAVANRSIAGGRSDHGLYRLTLSPSTLVANTSVELHGRRWTMVLWPLPVDRDGLAVLLMHESYHRIQPQLGLLGSGGFVTNGHLDTRAGRVWLRGELHALHVALESRGEKRRNALGDAVRMRLYRRSLFANAAVEEQQVEINEGLAESTGIDSGLSKARRVAFAVADLARVEAAPSFVREFPYGTGAAYAELLDAADVRWRRSVRPASDLAVLAANTYQLNVGFPSLLTARAAIARYDGVAIEEQETHRAQLIANRNVRYSREFESGPTLTLPLRKMRITIDPRAVEAFGTIGSVYHALTVSDTWGTLKVTGGDALIARTFDSVTVAAPASITAGTIAGNNWKLQLAPHARIVKDDNKRGSYKVK